LLVEGASHPDLPLALFVELAHFALEHEVLFVFGEQLEEVGVLAEADVPDLAVGVHDLVEVDGYGSYF